jgi:Na+/H+ antiporter NhaD/arsenite permease-like protein
VLPALLVFVASYALIAGLRVPGLRLDRPSAALVGAVLMVALRVVGPVEAGRDAVNHDTLLLLLGMMIVSGFLVEAGLFRRASWLTLTHVHSPRRLLVAVVFAAGGLSAVLVNDTVCLMFTPLVVQLVVDAKLRPLPFLLALMFGANAGSVATPTGNPQNMIIGTTSGISYARFTLALTLPALVALAVVAAVLVVTFRADLPARKLVDVPLPKPEVQPRLAFWSLLTLAGIVVAFFAGAPLSWTAMAGAAVLLVVGKVDPRAIFVQVDFVLLVFFGALFVIVYGVGKAGLAEAMFDRLQPLFGHTGSSRWSPPSSSPTSPSSSSPPTGCRASPIRPSCGCRPRCSPRSPGTSPSSARSRT